LNGATFFKGRAGGEPKHVQDHVEWILQRPFQNVAEWMGEEGDKWRKSQSMQQMPEECKAAWAVFHTEHRHKKLEDIVAELEALQKRVDHSIAAGRAHGIDARPKAQRRLRISR
jgi:hypothetical protein